MTAILRLYCHSFCFSSFCWVIVNVLCLLYTICCAEHAASHVLLRCLFFFVSWNTLLTWCGLWVVGPVLATWIYHLCVSSGPVLATWIYHLCVSSGPVLATWIYHLCVTVNLKLEMKEKKRKETTTATCWWQQWSVLLLPTCFIFSEKFVNGRGLFRVFMGL